MTNQLSVITNQAGLAEDKSKQLLESFVKHFQSAQVIAGEAKKIQVTDESQGEMMMQARKKRLELKQIRVEVEKTRVTLKEQIVREGKAIDGLANVIKALIVPVEEHLQTQEDFIKIRRELMLAKRSQERTTQLSTYEVMTEEFDLKNMSEEAYKQLLNSSKLAWEARQAEIKRQEEEAVAREKARVEEEKRLREENKKLQKEAELNRIQEDKRIREERRKLEVELAKRRAVEEKLRKEQEAKAKEQARLKAIEDARIKAETEKLLAPDREKLIQLAGYLDNLTLPAVKSGKAQAVLESVQAQLGEVSTYLRERAKTL
jgi:trichohyalin